MESCVQRVGLCGLSNAQPATLRALFAIVADAGAVMMKRGEAGECAEDARPITSNLRARPCWPCTRQALALSERTARPRIVNSENRRLVFQTCGWFGVRGGVRFACHKTSRHLLRNCLPANDFASLVTRPLAIRCRMSVDRRRRCAFNKASRHLLRNCLTADDFAALVWGGRLARRPVPGSLGLLPSGPDPVGEWRRPPPTSRR